MHRFLIYLSVVLGVGLTAPGVVAQDIVPARTITVSATGTATAVPDVAQLSLGVEASETTSARVLASVAREMAQVFAVLDTAGIPDADRQTTGLSLTPIYAPNSSGRSPRITGYTARNGLSVVIRDMSRLSAVVDAVTGAGANRLNGISFRVEDPEPLLDEARAEAAQAAAARAALYAEALGVSLGPLLQLTEGGGAVRPQPMMMRSEAAFVAASMPVAQGETTLSARVTLVYAIGG